MNCQELTQLLDDGDLRHLADARRREVDSHLSGCPDCAAEWRVQMRIAATPTPPAPPGFIEMCRRLVAAGAARHFGGRLVVVSALVVLAAAAAVLGWEQLTPTPTPVAAQVITASVVESADVPPVIESQPEQELDPTPQSSRSQPVAPLPQLFTVAVWPLQSEGVDSEGTAMAERFRDRVLSHLLSVPNLVLVDLQPGENSAKADFELRIKYEGTRVSSQSRAVQLEVLSAAEIAADKSSIEAEAAMSAQDRQRSEEGRRLAALQKRGFRTPGGNTTLGLLLGPGVPMSVTIETVGPSPGDRIENSAQLLVRELRTKVFPLDELYEQQLLEVLSKPSQRDSIRVQALGALLNYAERRGGFSQMSPAAVRAGGEFALTWETDVVSTRTMVWDGMVLTRSPELVPYLIQGMNESPRTETRLHLLKILAGTYGDEPRAKAAVVDAAKNNDQQTVRMAAMREMGDSQWIAYVGKTLMDTTLTDLQRLQPVAAMAPDATATSGTSPKSSLVLEDLELREFSTIIIRSAPDLEATGVVQRALSAVGAMDTPAALDMLIEVLNSLHTNDVPQGTGRAAISGVKQKAADLIAYRYKGNPKARAVVEEQARSGDPMQKMFAELQLQLMDMNATTDQVEQEQQAAPQPPQ